MKNTIMSERVREYMDAVCIHVGPETKRDVIIRELTWHIEAQKAIYMKEGMNELAAENRVIDELDDPLITAEKFGRAARPPDRDWVGIVANVAIWAISGGVALVGLIFGIGVAWAMISAHPGDFVVAILIGFGITFCFSFLAFLFLSICKYASNMLFYRGIGEDHSHRKGKWRKKP